MYRDEQVCKINT